MEIISNNKFKGYVWSCLFTNGHGDAIISINIEQQIIRLRKGYTISKKKHGKNFYEVLVKEKI